MRRVEPQGWQIQTLVAQVQGERWVAGWGVELWVSVSAWVKQAGTGRWGLRFFGEGAMGVFVVQVFVTRVLLEGRFDACTA